MEEFNENMHQRNQIIARLTRNINFYNSLNIGNLEEATVREIEARLARLDSIYEEFGEVQTAIERFKCITEGHNVKDEEKEREGFENAYFKLQGQLSAIISSFNNNIDYKCESQVVPKFQSSYYPSKVHLPPIKLPKFDGTYMKWLDFKEAFTGLIHNNSALSDYEKFSYLRSSLEGDACKCISHLKTNASLYATAWERLTNRYDNDEKIIKYHTEAILNQTKIDKPSHKELSNLYENINQNLRALEILGEPTENWGTLILYLIISKLDATTLQYWEEYKGKLLQINKVEIVTENGSVRDEKFIKKITFIDMNEFLEERCLVLESIETNKDKENVNNERFKLGPGIDKYKGSNRFQQSSSRTNSSFLSVRNQFQCYFCSKPHSIYQCQQFARLSPNERLNETRKRSLCLNCLRSGHPVEKCSSSGCRKCGKKHNTLVHVDKIFSSNLSSDTSEIQTVPINELHVQDAENKKMQVPVSISQNISQVEKYGNPANFVSEKRRIRNITPAILSTALVQIEASDGNVHEFRALLDNGAQNSFVTERLVDKLKLTKSKINISIVGVGQVQTNVNFATNIQMSSRNSSYSNRIPCMILKEITGNLPSFSFDIEQIHIPEHLIQNLADPQFNQSNVVDILIGSNIFWDLLCIGQIKLDSGIILQNTRLGWIVAGTMSMLPTRISQANFSIHFNAINDEQCLDNLITKFWNVEEIVSDSVLAPSEKFCEEHFKANHKRDNQGKFVVSIPFKENLNQLGNSREYALKRFLSLERKLLRNHELSDEYKKVMNEYIELNHMQEIQEGENIEELNYYLSHHAVVKNSSLTTRLRIVFDASMKTDSGLSLNDVQHSGAVIQNDLFSIILRFRKYRYVLTSDISKMYRMIFIQDDQHRFHRVLWRSDINEPIKCYEMNRLVFGTASAPFLAVRCLFQLGIDCKNSLISEIIKNDFYMDDCLTGSNSSLELIQIQRNLSQTLSSAGLDLRKWLSNDTDLYKEFNVNENLSSSILHIGESEANKTLGVLWNSNSDTIEFSISKFSENNVTTKRSVLSQISQVFDPLGLVGPVVVVAKLFIQSLWQEKISWDTELPNHLKNAWLHFCNDLQVLNTLKIPRHVAITEYVSIELHGFSDASEKAYAACLYIRCENKNGTYASQLLCAKSRVAPLKKITLPRLELCAALLLARLVHKVLESIKIKFNKVYLWSDSTITLCYIRGCPSKFKTFVANRASEIQQLTNVSDWQHVQSKDNPADLLSRGKLAADLIYCDLWWSGPTWLSEPILNKSEEPRENIELEIKELQIVNCTSKVSDFNIFSRFSTLLKLKRVMAYCLRFIGNTKTIKENRCLDSLSVLELESALEKLVQLAQKQSFPNEFELLSQKKQVHKRSSLLSLNPFLDEKHIIRVGGRIQKSSASIERKHPIILPNKHILTRLILEYEHHRLQHCGQTLLLSSIRDKFWPISGRNLTKQVVHRCVICFRVNPPASKYMMGNLPSERVNQCLPFKNVGVDYAGPFLVKDRSTRGARLQKAYVCLFICLATKAIHLELVSELTTQCFLAALRRFCSRRGKPSIIFSDNAKNFVGAEVILKQFFNDNAQNIIHVLSDENITWKFIPANSPNFGGIWEAGVKRTKYHLKRVLGNAHLTFEGFNTILTQIEAILNSRPLCPLSSNPDDYLALTPAHFLIGQPLTSIPDPDVRHVNENRLKLYQRLQLLVQHFWARWHTEYLSELQCRGKWQQKTEQYIKEGTLVLLKEDDAPPLKWHLARVVKLHFGKDGVLRVVTVKLPTTGSEVTRAITKICVFPFDRDNV